MFKTVPRLIFNVYTHVLKQGYILKYNNPNDVEMLLRIKKGVGKKECVLSLQEYIYYCSDKEVVLDEGI